MSKKKEEVLFHYTCKFHLPEIFKSGYLKLTDSNLIPPDGTLLTEIASKKYKPVVWLTDSDATDGHGLDGSMYDKTEIRIIIKRNPTMKWWRAWAKQNHMNKEWMKIFTDGYNSSSWYISQEIIPLKEIVRIENRYDGTVYYENGAINKVA